MTEPFEISVTLACPVAHAFRTFVGKVDLWWPRSHRKFERSTFSLEARVGGLLLERGPDGAEMTFGEVLAVDPPREIRLSWHPGKIDRPTEARITFAEVEGGTRVRVVHSVGDSGMGDVWPERVALFSKGWTAILASLDAYLKGDGGGHGA